MQDGGFSRNEAERLEALVARCDEATAAAAAIGDRELLSFVVDTCQHAIDAWTAATFAERTARRLLCGLN
jgi:hypothetical protein